MPTSTSSSSHRAPEGPWLKTWLLTLAMVVYAALFTWLGFLVSTTLFLCTGYLILGERLAEQFPQSEGNVVQLKK